MTFERTLAEAFKASGMTHVELAARVGATSDSQVRRWLRGDNTPGRFYRPRLEDVLGPIAWPEKEEAA